MNTKDKGDIAEANVLTRLKSIGDVVSIPFGDNARYDMIRDNGNSLQKVQVKYGRFKNGKVKFNCSSHLRENGSSVKSSYSKEHIDVFMIFCPETDEVYSVPVDEATNTEMCLRVEPTGNGQTKGINWAEEYIVE